MGRTGRAACPGATDADSGEGGVSSLGPGNLAGWLLPPSHQLAWEAGPRAAPVKRGGRRSCAEGAHPGSVLWRAHPPCLSLLGGLS